MKTLLQQALDMFSLGYKEEAWKIAKLDKGLLPDVSKEEWFQFANKAIERRRREAESLLPDNYF